MQPHTLNSRCNNKQTSRSSSFSNIKQRILLSLRKSRYELVDYHVFQTAGYGPLYIFFLFLLLAGIGSIFVVVNERTFW